MRGAKKTLMTNMTFTKGIGTPVYMAPEVLGQEKYKMPADIFSFAITMYECFSWSEAYPKKQFKFPWKIAEFVMNGNRPENKPSLTKEQYELIEKSWVHDPKERIDIKEIIEHLDRMFLK